MEDRNSNEPVKTGDKELGGTQEKSVATTARRKGLWSTWEEGVW